MKCLNEIAVFDPSGRTVLMCKRRKNPYIGLMIFVGGKIENGERGLDAAYRELEEETSISRNDTKLIHLMNFDYIPDDVHLEVYFGTLNQAMEVHGEENDLYWVDADEDFFDMSLYGGDGNIGHIMERIRLYNRSWSQNNFGRKLNLGAPL